MLMKEKSTSHAHVKVGTIDCIILYFSLIEYQFVATFSLAYQDRF